MTNVANVHKILINQRVWWWRWRLHWLKRMWRMRSGALRGWGYLWWSERCEDWNDAWKEGMWKERWKVFGMKERVMETVERLCTTCEERGISRLYNMRSEAQWREKERGEVWRGKSRENEYTHDLICEAARRDKHQPTDNPSRREAPLESLNTPARKVWQ